MPLIFQAFEWNLPNDGKHWNRLKEMAPWIKSQGFDAIWLPPVNKAAFGAESCDSVGYGAYDLWDLGEFHQSGSIRTKYGTKDELLAMIQEMHNHNIQVYVDAVLNHKTGNEKNNIPVTVDLVNPRMRHERLMHCDQVVHAHFDFSQERDRYSDFIWQPVHFTGWAPRDNFNEIFINPNKEWDHECPDHFTGNCDYLLGSDIDLRHPDVQEELIRWGKWMVHEIGMDGFRLDALRHMNRTFIKKFIHEIKKSTSKPVFFFGEYAAHDFEDELNRMDHLLALNDFQLQHQFFTLSRYSNQPQDLRKLFHTFSFHHTNYSAPFVNSHDFQPRNKDSQYIERWLQPAAHAILLLTEQINPIVSWVDIFGTEPSTSCIQHDHNHGLPAFPGQPHTVQAILTSRNRSAYGECLSYQNESHTIGFTRLGDLEHSNSGLAVVISTKGNASEWMHVGSWRANQKFKSLFQKQIVQINEHGWGCFSLLDRGCDIWLPIDQWFEVTLDETVHSVVKIAYQRNHGITHPILHYRPFSENNFYQVIPISQDDQYAYFEMDLGESSGMEYVFTDGNGYWEKARNWGCNFIAFAGSWEHDPRNEEHYQGKVFKEE